MTDQPKDDPKAMACPKCAGNMLERGFFGNNSLVFVPEAGKIAWTGNHASAAKAMVCDDCGYAELYATKPDKLRDR